jgi:hypothetical protein
MEREERQVGHQPSNTIMTMAEAVWSPLPAWGLVESMWPQPALRLHCLLLTSQAAASASAAAHNEAARTSLRDARSAEEQKLLQHLQELRQVIDIKPEVVLQHLAGGVLLETPLLFHCCTGWLPGGGGQAAGGICWDHRTFNNP